MALDPGKYHGVLKSGVTSVSKTSRNPQMALVFDVTHRLEDGNWAEMPAAQERTIYLSMSDNAWKYTESKLNALGFNGSFDAPEFSHEVKTEGVELECVHEEFQGKTREKWELSSWGDGPAIEPAPSDIVRMLNARWKAKNNGGARASAPAPTPAPSAPAPAPAAPAAAPAPSPAATGICEVNTRDEAWAEVLAGQKGNPTAAAEAWAKAIAKVTKNNGKEEADFGPDEWTAVAADASIPF